MDGRYTLEEAHRTVGLPTPTIRRLIKDGFVSPARGARREYRFGFQDLVVLRMAKALSEAKLSSRRIGQSLRRLRKQLPDAIPIAGLRITAIGSDVVVVEREARWRVNDGQYLLAFEVSQDNGALLFQQAVKPTQDLFAQAFALEELSPAEAIAYYEKAIHEDPCLAGAYANLGRMLHEAGRLDEADDMYARGDASCDDDAILLYNYALLREDQHREDEAVQLYRRAIEADPGLADAYYNLALLYQAQGKGREALRHLSAYRKLTR